MGQNVSDGVLWGRPLIDFRSYKKGIGRGIRGSMLHAQCYGRPDRSGHA